jgi:parallel beta-helix repeat protein
MNSRAIIVLAGTVFGILAALLLASPLAFSQPCTVIVTNEVTLVEALDGDGTADILPGQTLCIGANINLADADGSGVVDITVAFSVSPTSEAQRITIRGEPEIDPATGLPARTLTVTTTALANALFDLDPSADFVTIKSLNLNPGGSIAAPRAIRTNAGTFAFRAENLRLLDNGDQDWSTAAFALAGDNAVILNNRVEDQDGGTAVCILLQGTADNATIDGNRCANDTTDRAQDGIEVNGGSTARHVIQGNTIIGYESQGISILTAGAPPRHLIQNNTILGDNAMDIGIYTDGGADGDAAAPGPIIGPGNSVFDITTGAVQLNGNFNVVRDNASSFGGPGGAPPGNPLNATYGIQVVGTDAVISNNSLYLAGATVGIDVTGAADRTTIIGNRITKDEGDGIRVASGADEGNIASNTIRAKDGDGDLAFDEDGIEVASSANIIRDNDIDLDNPDVAGDQRTGDHGINVTGNDNQILGNHVQRVGGDGVNITGTRNRVDSGSACLIENNAGNGVNIATNGNNFVFNCTIRNNLGDGVNVATDNNLIQGNTITGNAGDGVELNSDNADNNVVGVGGPNPAATQANTITGNGGSGVKVNDGDENLIKGNTISGNILNQILLTTTIGGNGATKNIIKENTITAASDGIVVAGDLDDNNTIEKNTISGDAGSTGIRITDADGIIVKDNTLTGPGAAVAGIGIRNTGGMEANRNKFTGNKIKNWSIGMVFGGGVAHAYNCNVFQDNATGVRVTGTGTGNELNFQDVVAFDPAATQGNDFINNTTAHIDHQGTATVDGQNNFFFGAFAGTLPADSLVVFGPGDGSAFGFVVGATATAALQLKRTGTSCSGFTPPGGGGGGGGGGSAPVLGDVNLRNGFEQSDLDELLDALHNRSANPWLTDPTNPQFKASDVARPCGKITRADYNRLLSSWQRVQRGRPALKSQCGSKGTIGFDPASAPRLLTVLSGQAGAAGVRVAIYDFAGRLLLEQKATGAQVALDLVQRELANGVYLAVVESLAADGRTLVREVRKVIVLR